MQSAMAASGRGLLQPEHAEAVREGEIEREVGSKTGQEREQRGNRGALRADLTANPCLWDLLQGV